MVAILNGALAEFVPVALLAVAFSGLLIRMRLLSVSLVCSIVLGAYGSRAGLALTGTSSLACALLFGGLCGLIAGLGAAALDGHFVGKGGFLGLLASLGALRAVEGLIEFIDGGGVTLMPVNLASASRGGLLGFPSWLASGITMLVMVSIVQGILLSNTAAGVASVALGDDPELASLFGVASSKVLLIVEGLGGAIAGAAGVFLAVDGGLRPDLGLGVALKSFGALIAAGNDYLSLFVWCAALVVLEQTCGYLLSGQLREAAGLVFLVAALLVRGSDALQTSSIPSERR